MRAVALRFPRHLGDVLTLLRIVGTPLFVVLVAHAPRDAALGWAAGALFAVIAASDFFDGRFARRAGGVGPYGRVLDHGADIAFVLAALITYVGLEIAPWWVPASIAASFGTYAYDSWFSSAGHRPASPSNRIGHIGGVLNYVLIGVLVFNNSAAVQLIPRELLWLLFACVPLYSGAAIVQRWRRVPVNASADSQLQRSSSSR